MALKYSKPFINITKTLITLRPFITLINTIKIT
jgi:hypothetical protein